MTSSFRRCAWFTLCLCWLSACQNQQPPADVASDPGPTTVTPTPPSPDQPALPVGPNPVDDPVPVQAVKRVLEQIDAGQLDALAEFLPDSYQRDLEKLFRTLAAKTPDDAWDQLHAVAEKTARLLTEQSTLVSQAAGGTVPDDEDAHREQLRTTLEPFANGDHWRRGQWQEFQLKEFLAGPASSLYSAWQRVSPAQSRLSAQTQVRLLSEAGDQATLEFQSAIDIEPRKVEFVRVEGKWIPKSLAESLPAAVSQALTQLESVTETESAAVTARLRPLLLQIAGTLDQMALAERPEELQLGWWQIQSLWLQHRQNWVEPGPPPRVELRLSGDVSDRQLSQLLERLLEITDQPDLAEYLTIPTATGTVIHLSPVKEFDRFMSRLKFVTVTSQDDASRSVNIELPSAQP